MSKQRIFIAGHRGMVGSAIRRQLEQRGDVELVLRTRDELNLLDSRAVHDFFASERIDPVSYTHLVLRTFTTTLTAGRARYVTRRLCWHKGNTSCLLYTSRCV